MADRNPGLAARVATSGRAAVRDAGTPADASGAPGNPMLPSAASAASSTTMSRAGIARATRVCAAATKAARAASGAPGRKRTTWRAGAAVGGRSGAALAGAIVPAPTADARQSGASSARRAARAGDGRDMLFLQRRPAPGAGERSHTRGRAIRSAEPPVTRRPVEQGQAVICALNYPRGAWLARAAANGSGEGASGDQGDADRGDRRGVAGRRRQRDAPPMPRRRPGAASAWVADGTGDGGAPGRRAQAMADA